MQNRLLMSFSALATLLIASPACAEVADKIASLGALWTWTLGLNIAAFLLAFVRPLLGLIVVPFAAFLAWGAYEEMSDPYVGPAILSELGQDYILGAYASAGVGVVGPLVIVLAWWTLRKKRAST